MMRKILLLLILSGFIVVHSFAQINESDENIGKDAFIASVEQSLMKPGGAIDAIPAGGLLLIPESSNDRIMAFDPQNGDLVDADFIPANASYFSTPLHPILNADGSGILISDQVADVVYEFDLDGNYLGVFAPAGGANNAILDNIRAITWHPNGNLLVCNSSGGSDDAVVEISPTGTYVQHFTPVDAVDPFYIYHWVDQSSFLICDIFGSDTIREYDYNGNFIKNLTGDIAYPQQIIEASNGNFLVAGFSIPSGIHEVQTNGTIVGTYDAITGIRGVYELGNGNVLVTNGAGVHEVDISTNTLVETKISGVSARFITFVPGSTTIDVTFRVDMQEQTVPPEGVHLAGSFSAPYPTWDPAGITMDAPALGDVWTKTLQLDQNTTYEYKFVNGNAWGLDESVYGPCGAGNGNRIVTIGQNDTTLDLVCFGSCLSCTPPEVNVTFQVDMSNETVSPNGVHVAGSFQGWNPAGTPLIDQGNGIWSTTAPVAITEYVEYKFINGNAWGSDESVPPECAAGNNRYFSTPAVDTTLGLVCFSSCDPCTSVTDINVTFRVDMSNETVAPEGVHIAGSFQGWDPFGTVMTDVGSGIWEYSTVLQSGAYHEYKFINGQDWPNSENVPWYCNNNGNRFLTVPSSDTTLPNVCYGSCLVCNPPPVDVLFQVDMSNQQVSANGVHLAGSFQGWDPALTPMTDAGGGVYQVSLTLGEGEFHEYKFINGNTFDGAETITGGCENFSGNREFFVPDANLDLDLVCFAECDVCVTPTHTFDFSVYLQGVFNGVDMNTTLWDNGLIPDMQPFNAAPWNYTGTETVAGSPATNVVDWVLVDLRTTPGDSSTATPDKSFHMFAGLLLKDGSIVNVDGTTLPSFTGNIFDNLYVVIFTRNHLPIMSKYVVAPTDGDYVYDFTADAGSAYGDNQADLGGGMYGMYAGDSNGDMTIDSNDIDTDWASDAGKSGYMGADLNHDGQINNIDKDDYWVPNNGKGAILPQ